MEQYNQNSINNDESEIDIKDLFKVIYLKKWVVVLTILIFVTIGVAFSLSLPNKYKSTVTLIPAAGDSVSSGLSGIAGQFGGLAALAGVNLGGSEIDQTTIALETLVSREFLFKFIDDHKFKSKIFAAEKWDPKSGRLTYDSEIYDVEKNSWVREASFPKQREPSLAEVYKVFLEEQLSISQDKKTGLITLSVEHPSPIVAKEIVDKLVSSINKKMQSDSIIEANKSIDYLNKEIEKNKVAAMESILYQLMEKQFQNKMLANVRDEYVLKTLDEAIIPEEKSSPKRALIVIFTMLLGGFSSIFIILLHSYWFSGKGK